MSVLPHPLSLNPLKDTTTVDEVDYSADFDNLYLKIDDFDKFFRTGKVSYNKLRIYVSWSAVFNRNEKEMCR